MLVPTPVIAFLAYKLLRMGDRSSVLYVEWTLLAVSAVALIASVLYTLRARRLRELLK